MITLDELLHNPRVHERGLFVRLKEKATIDDCLLVIEYKANEWLYSETMRDYVRPKTLFSPQNFPTYLVQARKWAEKNGRSYGPKDEEAKKLWIQILDKIGETVVSMAAAAPYFDDSEGIKVQGDKLIVRFNGPFAKGGFERRFKRAAERELEEITGRNMSIEGV